MEKKPTGKAISVAVRPSPDVHVIASFDDGSIWEFERGGGVTRWTLIFDPKETK